MQNLEVGYLKRQDESNSLSVRDRSRADWPACGGWPGCAACTTVPVALCHGQRRFEQGWCCFVNGA